MAKKELKLEDVKLRARRDWVLCKPIEKESKKTTSGLVRPDNDEDEQKAVGTIINYGEDTNGLSKGAVCVYGLFAGERIEVIEKGKTVEYVLLRDEDIVAFVE